MTLIISVPESKEAALKARAEAQGVSAEQYVEKVLDEDLQNSEVESLANEVRDQHAEAGTRKHISEIMEGIPPEAMETMPADGASEHDHYLYGWPKRHS